MSEEPLDKSKTLENALKGVNLPEGVSFVCDVDERKPTKDGFECKAPPRSAEKFEEKQRMQQENQH